MSGGFARHWRWLALACASVGLVLVAQAAWVQAKGLVAQRLIAASWKGAQAGEAARPWPWADMRPIARMALPARGVELYVLDNASLRTLAFGPGHVGGTATPGGWGHSVVVAHRDTHFAFLRTLQRDELIEVEARGGTTARYRVQDTAVLHRDEARALEAAHGRLTLVTCHPREGERRDTPWRYVVVAERIA